MKAAYHWGVRVPASEVPEEQLEVPRLVGVDEAVPQQKVDADDASGYPFSTLGKEEQSIENVGDVMYDVALYYRHKALRIFSI